jgi:hypothetical protein
LSPTQFSCSCPRGFGGQRCLTVVSNSVCKSDTCLNGGTCTPLSPTTYSCSCPNGYSGTNCQMNVIYPPQQSPQSASCADSQPSCATWSAMGLCSLVNSKDPTLCRKSCGLC